jgi:hypothetical protein
MSELIRRMFPYEGEPYGWMLTFDHFDNKPSSVAGPNAMSDEILARLKAGEGKEFRMFDDDKNLMASGRYIGPKDETEFRPLDDFGTANWGCTMIQYRNKKGKFETI